MTKAEQDSHDNKPQSYITINHQNSTYKILKKHLSLKSKFVSYFDNIFFQQFFIPDIFDESTVQSFIKFIEKSQVSVKMNKTAEFLSLAEILGCERITSKAKILTTNVPKEDILSQYLILLNQSIDCFTVEKLIIQNLGYYIKAQKDLLIKIPMCKLSQIIQKSLYNEDSEKVSMSELTILCSTLVHEYGNSGLQILPLINFEKVSDESLSNLACELQFIEQTPQVTLIINLNYARESKEKELKRVWKLLYNSVVDPSSKDEPKLEVANMLQSGKYLPHKQREYTNIILGLLRNKNPKAQYIYSQMIIQSNTKSGEDEGESEYDISSNETFKSSFSNEKFPSAKNGVHKRSLQTLPQNGKNASSTNNKQDEVYLTDNPANPIMRRMSTSCSSPNLSSSSSALNQPAFAGFPADSISPLGAASVALANSPALNKSSSILTSNIPMTAEERDALRYLKLSADKNYEPAILKLSELIIRDKTLLKTRGMLKYIQKAAILGDSNAEFVLGVFYREGINLKQDMNAALEMFAASAYHQNINGLFQYNKLNTTSNKRLFFLLISTGNIDLVKEHLSFDHLAINSLDFQSWSAAHYSVFSDTEQTSMLEFLYSNYNIDLEALTITGAKPIHIACLKGNLKAVMFLLEKGNPQSVHSMTYKKELPIHFACKSGNSKLVKYLLYNCNCKDEIFSETLENWMCIHYACECGSHFIVRELLKCDPSLNSLNAVTNNKETPLILACKSGNIILVSKLLKTQIGNQQFYTTHSITGANVLHYSCLSGNPQLIHLVASKLIGKFGVAILNAKTTMNENILHFACLSGNVKAVNYVIKSLGKKNDIYSKNIFNENMLHYACKSGSEDLVMNLKKNYYFEMDAKNAIFFYFEINFVFYY